VIELLGSPVILGRTDTTASSFLPGVGMVSGSRMLVAQPGAEDALAFEITPVDIVNYRAVEGARRQVSYKQSYWDLTFTFRTGYVPWIIHMSDGVNVVVHRRTEDNRLINLESQQKVDEELILVDDDGNAITGPEDALWGVSEVSGFPFRFSDTELGLFTVYGQTQLRLEIIDVVNGALFRRGTYVVLLEVPGAMLEIVNHVDMGNGRCFIVLNDPVSGVHYLLSTDISGFYSSAVEGTGQLRNPGHMAKAGTSGRVLGWFTYGGFNDFAFLDIIDDFGVFSGTVSASPLSIPRWDLDEITWQTPDTRSQGGLTSGTLLYWTYDYSPNRTIYLTELKTGPEIGNELSWNWTPPGMDFNDVTEYRQLRPGLGALVGTALDGSSDPKPWVQLVGNAVPPPLRMNQRDDGLSVPSGQAPRIRRVSNQPSSVQTTESPRMKAGGQRYL